jgi:hypothetical protein
LIELTCKEYNDEIAQQNESHDSDDREHQRNQDAFIEYRGREKFLVFDVLLDHRYPFYQPQIFCRTPFSKPPINDGRDVFKDVLKGDWKVTNRLYEMVSYIPEFVVDVLIAQQENGMLMHVYGEFHLGNLYEMSNWGAVNGVNRDSKVFECEE